MWRYRRARSWSASRKVDSHTRRSARSAKADGGVARRGVHHEGEALSGPMHAHVVDRDAPFRTLEHTGSDQLPDVRALDPEPRQAFRDERAAVGFLDPPSEGIDRVEERRRDEPDRAPIDHAMCDGERMETEVWPVVEDRRVPKPVDIRSTAGREVEVDWARASVEREASQDSGQPETMVTVEVGDADRGDRPRRDLSPQELALGALAGVEEDRLVVPSQHIAVVIAGSRRHLCSGAEDHELS